MAIRIPSKDQHIFSSVTEFLSTAEVPPKFFAVELGGLPIDFEFEDNGSNTTVIFFHAALSPKAESIPIYAGKGISKGLNANRLSIGDPSLALDSDLRLAWFAGSAKQPTLQNDLSSIIKHVTRSQIRTIYFGASGGGFAALQYSSNHEDSIAITINPQTNIERYSPKSVSRWVESAWEDRADEGERVKLPDVITDLTSVYQYPIKNHVVYVQNTGDTFHVDHHWEPFKNRLNKSNKLIEVFIYSGKGHVAPPVLVLRSILQSAIELSSIMELDVSAITKLATV